MLNFGDGPPVQEKTPPPFQGSAKRVPFAPGLPLVTLGYYPPAPLGPNSLAPFRGSKKRDALFSVAARGLGWLSGKGT